MSAAIQPVIPVVPRRPWGARVFSLPTVLGLFLVSMLFLLTGGAGGQFHSLADPDIWWHLRNAAQLVHTGHFVRTDTFSFTVAGKPWINSEWLAELPYYLGWTWLGERGVYLAMMLAMGLVFAGIYWLACLRSGDCKAAFFASFVGFHFITVSMAPRTLLFGWILLIVELAVLWSLAKGRDFTLVLPPLFMVWINTHGSWLIGFVLMVVFFACGFVQRDWGGLYATAWTTRQKRKFSAITAASFALLFVNPYGWRLVAYPADVLFHNKLGTGWISDWYSLDFHSARGKIVLATLLGMAGLQLIRRRRWPLQDLAFAMIAIYGGLTYVRFLFLAGILLMPMLAMDLRGLLLEAYVPEKDRRSTNAVAMALLLVLMWAFCPTEKQLHAGISAEYPEKALPCLRSLAGRGRLFNAYEWGGYLEWQVPELKEFVDTRVDIFVHEGVMQDYLKAVGLQDPSRVVDKYQIRYVLLPKGKPLTDLLGSSPAWKRSYDDGQAVVFERVQ